MQRGKIAFGKISFQLNNETPAEKAASVSSTDEEESNGDGNEVESKVSHDSRTGEPVAGFKKIDNITIKQKSLPARRKEIDGDLDMIGFNNLGQKAAKKFDIQVSKE